MAETGVAIELAGGPDFGSVSLIGGPGVDVCLGYQLVAQNSAMMVVDTIVVSVEDTAQVAPTQMIGQHLKVYAGQIDNTPHFVFPNASQYASTEKQTQGKVLMDLWTSQSEANLHPLIIPVNLTIKDGYLTFMWQVGGVGGGSGGLFTLLASLSVIGHYCAS